MTEAGEGAGPHKARRMVVGIAYLVIVLRHVDQVVPCLNFSVQVVIVSFIIETCPCVHHYTASI